MLADELEHKLSRRFDLICFVDLGDLRHQHRLVFDLFQSLYQPTYGPNQRLVLYTEHLPEQDFLNHIQRAATKVDISNWFIIIVCPYNIQDQLVVSNKKFGNDRSVIQSMIEPLQQTKIFGAAGFAIVDSLCPLPFAQVMIKKSGEVQPCCKFQGSIGNLNQTDINQVFQGRKAATLRKQLATGQRPKECSICWQNESSGTTSHRQLAIHKYGKSLDQGWFDDPQVRDVSWMPTSLCNFSCRICHAESSTSIAVEELKTAETEAQTRYLRHLIKNPHNNKNKEIMQSFSKLPGLDFLHVMGGEPFIWPDLSALIDLLIDQGLASRMTMEFHTNGSTYPTQHLQRILPNFKALEVSVSVDNVGPRFEIERAGRWHDVLANLEKFAAIQSPSVRIRLASVINLQNVLYLDDLVDLSDYLKVQIVWSYLESPECLSIDRGTQKVIDLVAAKYLNHRDAELQKVAARMMTSTGSDGKEFLAYCAMIDARKSQCFYETHSEIYLAMGGRV